MIDCIPKHLTALFRPFKAVRIAFNCDVKFSKAINLRNLAENPSHNFSEKKSLIHFHEGAGDILETQRTNRIGVCWRLADYARLRIYRN